MHYVYSVFKGKCPEPRDGRWSQCFARTIDNENSYAFFSSFEFSWQNCIVNSVDAPPNQAFLFSSERELLILSIKTWRSNFFKKMFHDESVI